MPDDLVDLKGVSRADVEAVCAYARRVHGSPCGCSVDVAVDRLLAALPPKPWEPDEALVEAWQAAMLEYGDEDWYPDQVAAAMKQLERHGIELRLRQEPGDG